MFNTNMHAYFCPEQNELKETDKINISASIAFMLKHEVVNFRPAVWQDIYSSGTVPLIFINFPCKEKNLIFSIVSNL